MKRRITSLLTAVLLMLAGLPASAALDELTLKTVSIGEAAATMTPDTQWYLVWNKRVYTTQGGGYWEDKGAGQRACMSAGVEVIQEGDYASDKAQFLVRFLSTDEEGKYLIQFGTGNYLQANLNTAAAESSAAGFNVYNINGTDEHFGVNVWNMAARVDQNGSGATMATWGSGEITDIGGNNDFTIYPVDIIESSDLDYAIAHLNTVFGTYSDYLPNWGSKTFDRGTDIGQYNFSDETYNTFVENLQRALTILEAHGKGETLDATIEEIEAIIKNIEDAYAEIMASIVKLTIANGNYRIVSALEWTRTTTIDTGEVDENGNPITQSVTTHPTKAMYATLEGNAMWADIDSTDCRYLWQLTTNAETELVKVMNIATDGILNSCSQSTQATLTADSQTEMLFEFIERREDGKVVVVLKPSTGGARAYLHCNNHGGGSGNASNIVGWEATAGASQWILEPVSDEEVQELVDAYAPIKDHELMVSMFQDLITETEAAIAQAKDDQYVTVRTSLITSTDQFSSPFSDPTEGSFSNVLSDDASTFWHSSWQNGNVSSHTHYFQVALAEPVEGDIQCFMRRRSGAGYDHITALGVFGTNDESALDDTTEDGWTNLGTFDLSENATQGQTVYSNSIALNDIPNLSGVQYLRFYIDGTTTDRGYGHFATFQLYNLTINGNTQWSQMGDAATAIDEALATAKDVDLDEVDMSDYEALKAALDAFKTVLCNPGELYNAINANKDVAELVVIGDNPGFWSEDSDTGILASTLQQAQEYLMGGNYTQEQLDAYTTTINDLAGDLMSTANPVEEGKWYAIKYDSEENFEAHSWSKSSAVNTTLGDLYDNYVAPANVEEDELVSFSELSEVKLGQALRFINEDIIQEMDQIAFRFVAQGDTAFVIQHKSGLYLSGASRSTNLTLGLTPALFNVKAVGYGKVIIEARDLNGQGYYADAPVYLHAQNAGHSLVTWNNDAVGSSSALYIEPIETGDFDEGDDIAGEVSMNVKPNSMIFMCYPAGFAVEGAELYAYQGAIPEERTLNEQTEVASYVFNRIEQAQPGQPVLLVSGDSDYFDAEDEEEEPTIVTLIPTGSSFAPDPVSEGGIHGTYTYQWVDKGTLVVGGGKIGSYGSTLVLAEGEDNTDCTRDVSANTGYIVYGENILSGASADEFDLVIRAGRPQLMGDLNGDAKVDIADAVSVLNIMAEDGNSPEADINGDGKVDIADFVSILNIMAEQ